MEFVCQALQPSNTSVDRSKRCLHIAGAVTRDRRCFLKNFESPELLLKFPGDVCCRMSIMVRHEDQNLRFDEHLVVTPVTSHTEKRLRGAIAPEISGDRNEIHIFQPFGELLHVNCVQSLQIALH